MRKIRKKTQRAIRRRGRNIARPKKGEAAPAGLQRGSSWSKSGRGTVPFNNGK